MLPLDVIRSVDDAWNGSRLALSTIDSYAPIVRTGQNDTMIIMLIVVAVVALIMFRRVASTVAGSFQVLFSDAGKDNVLKDSSYGYLSLLTTVILIPVYSFVLTATGVSNRGIWLTIMIVAGLLVFRLIMFWILAGAGNEPGVYMLKKHSDSAFILMMALTLPVYLLSICLAPDRQGVPAVYIAAVAALCLTVYFAICAKRILSSGFSHFFCFLYLCTLEILPIVVVVKILVS